jgi:hypothetical protein
VTPGESPSPWAAARPPARAENRYAGDVKKPSRAAKKAPAVKKAAAKKAAVVKKAAVAKRAPAAKGAAAKRPPPPRKPAPRADLGAPVDGFFARQPAPLRPILDELRRLVLEVAPEATSQLKWGMPFYEVNGNIVCALAGFKGHVNLILPGAPGVLADPDGRLEGEGKTGQHLKLRSLDELPREAVRGWLRATASRARAA